MTTEKTRVLIEIPENQMIDLPELLKNYSKKSDGKVMIASNSYDHVINITIMIPSKEKIDEKIKSLNKLLETLHGKVLLTSTITQLKRIFGE